MYVSTVRALLYWIVGRGLVREDVVWRRVPSGSVVVVVVEAVLVVAVGLAVGRPEVDGGVGIASEDEDDEVE